MRGVKKNPKASQGVTETFHSRLQAWDKVQNHALAGHSSGAREESGESRDKTGNRPAETKKPPDPVGPRRLPSSKGSRPVSRVLSGPRADPWTWTVIPLGRTSPSASSGLPGSRVRAPRAPAARAPRFGLAPGGVYRATDRYRPCGALLPHLFTLTCASRRRPSAVCFLRHFPWALAPQALPGTLPCGARTFLRAARGDRPADFHRDDSNRMPKKGLPALVPLARPVSALGPAVATTDFQSPLSRSSSIRR